MDEKHPGGRPKGSTKRIDYKVLEALCKLQCTDAELAVGLGVSIDTITRRKQDSPKFLRIYRNARESSKTSLRRLQWQKALEGNPGMLIWLGKQYLDQSEKAEMTGSGGQPLVPAPQMRVVGNGNLATVVQSLVDCGAVKVCPN